MRGTTSALRTILGPGLGIDHRDEFVHPVNGRPFHIFDGFALVNRLLCSAGLVNSSQGRPTRARFQNCAEHFVATTAMLEPTLVILQGSSVAKWTNAVLEPGRSYGEHHYEAHLHDKRMIVCTFSHPSARGELRWGDQPHSPYMLEVVAPTLRDAVRRL
jgi:uracil-DNA glycosylase